MLPLELNSFGCLRSCAISVGFLLVSASNVASELAHDYHWNPVVQEPASLGEFAVPEVSMYASLIEELQARASGPMVEIPDEALQSFEAWEEWLGGVRV